MKARVAHHKKINVIHHITRMKVKPHIIILVGTENNWQIQHVSMIQHNKLGLEGYFLKVEGSV